VAKTFVEIHRFVLRNGLLFEPFIAPWLLYLPPALIFRNCKGSVQQQRRERNIVLRRLFGPRSDEVTGEWRRLHNEELNDLYCSPNTVREIKWGRMRWAVHVARMGEERGVYRVLVGKSEGKRPLGRPRRRWICRRWDVGIWTGLGWPRIETGDGRL